MPDTYITKLSEAKRFLREKLGDMGPEEIEAMTNALLEYAESQKRVKIGDPSNAIAGVYANERKLDYVGLDIECAWAIG